MPSQDEPALAPIYLELAPQSGAPAPVDHLFAFRDCGKLSGRGTGRFATDLFTLSVTLRTGAGALGRPRFLLAPPRPAFRPRRAPFSGAIVGLRLGAAPDRAPSDEALEELTPAPLAVAREGGPLSALVVALDRVACARTFGQGPPAPASARSERRSIRAATGISRRRLAAIRRFRHLLDGLAASEQPLSDVALEAGYYDQPHMSAACRAFAGNPPGAIRRLAGAQSAGRFFQDDALDNRLRLVIDA